MIGHSLPSLEEMPYIPTMLKNRINLVLVPALAATIPILVRAQPAAPPLPTPPGLERGPAPAPALAPTPPPGGATAPAPDLPPTEAERALDDAAKKVAALKAVAADLLEKVEMLGQKFEIKGRYLKADNHRHYLRLAIVGLVDASGIMLQICDGDLLWDYQQVFDSQSYRKLKIVPVFEKLNSPEMDPEIRDQIVAQMGLSGPESLLIGLRKAIHFDLKEAGTFDGKPVWILRGTWKDRQGLLGPNQQPLPATAPLPAYIPSRASVWIGQEDGWPYQVRLVGRPPSLVEEDNRQRDALGRPMGSRAAVSKVPPSAIILIYSNVQINPELKPAEFAFQPPPEAKPEDGTEAILAGLDRLLQDRAARKKAEAAKSEPLLNQAIDVPKSDPGGTAPTLPPPGSPAPAPAPAPPR
jgi:hypothetical protein